MKVLARPIHFQATYVHANDDRKCVAGSSAYIRRCNSRANQSSLLAAGDYVTRARDEQQARAEVAEVRFFCRGSHTSETIWGAVDQAFRTKAGAYSKRGGKSPGKGKTRSKPGIPRLALFIDATLPLDISEDRKVAIGVEMAEALVDRFGCAVEAAWHRKKGVVDHLHLLVSTRIVDEDGVGPVIRGFNGIASKHDVKTDGADVLPPSAHMEWMRSTFASVLSRETGHSYDARSYERQGNGIEPVPYVSRKRIEDKKRAGRDTWREERRAKIAAREIFTEQDVEGSIVLPPDQAEIGVTKEPVVRPVDTIHATDVTRPASVAATPGNLFEDQRDVGKAGTFVEVPMPETEDRFAAARVSPAVIAGLVGLAVPVEQRFRGAEQNAATAGRRTDRMDPNDLVAEQWQQVDEQNRREASADVLRRNAEREASA